MVENHVVPDDGGVDSRILNYLEYFRGMYEVELVGKKLAKLGDGLDCVYVSKFLKTFGQVEEQMVPKIYHSQKDQRPDWMLNDELFNNCLHIAPPCHHEYVLLCCSDDNHSPDGFTLVDIINVARHMHDQ